MRRSLSVSKVAVRDHEKTNCESRWNLQRADQSSYAEAVAGDDARIKKQFCFCETGQCLRGRLRRVIGIEHEIANVAVVSAALEDEFKRHHSAEIAETFHTRKNTCRGDFVGQHGEQRQFR